MGMGGHFVMIRLVQTGPFDDRKIIIFVADALEVGRSACEYFNHQV